MAGWQGGRGQSDGRGGEVERSLDGMEPSEPEEP